MREIEGPQMPKCARCSEEVNTVNDVGLCEDCSEEEEQMSEIEKIIGRFKTAKYFEYRAVGLVPVVCVAGHISYAELGSAIDILANGVGFVRTEWNGWIEFDGVKIYPSRAFEEGFYFGHIEPKP